MLSDNVSYYGSYWNVDTLAWDRMTEEAKSLIAENPDGGESHWALQWDLESHLHVSYLYGKECEERYGSQLHVLEWRLCAETSCEVE